MLEKDDVNWLIREAKNEKTRKIVKAIEAAEHNFAEKGKVSKGSGFICLNLGQYNVWTKKSCYHSIAHTYVDIFRHKHTNLNDSFFGNDNHVVFDIGANDGFYVLKIKQDNQAARVYAIEPNPISFEIMEKNVKSNKLKNVFLIKKAVDRKNGKRKLSIVENVTNIGSFYLDSLWKRDWLTKDRIKKITVETITLDKFYKTTQEKTIDLIKIDAEGGEFDIISKGKKCLSNTKKVIIEYHSMKLRDDVLKLMKDYGFKLVFEEKSRIRLGSLYFVNSRNQ